MNAPRRILVRGVNWLGDAVMTTPALLRLREAFPAAHIALSSPAKIADLWREHPAVNEVIPLRERESAWSVGRRLRPGHFDLALILPNSPRSALECLIAGIPCRVGMRRQWRTWLLTRPVRPRAAARRMLKPSVRQIQERLVGKGETGFRIPEDAHHSLDYLHLVAALGANPAPLAPLLVVTPSEVEGARLRHGLESGVRWLGLNPGAEYGPAKRWPASRFAQVAREVTARSGIRWVLFGGPRDAVTTAEIAGALPRALDLAGRTQLRELMALLASCRLVLTNDTGPMHVAAAMGTPVVVPFGSTSPELTGPGRPGDPRHRLMRGTAACSPCFLRECPIDFRCMEGISVERVVAEVTSVLHESEELV